MNTETRWIYKVVRFKSSSFFKLGPTLTKSPSS